MVIKWYLLKCSILHIAKYLFKCEGKIKISAGIEMYAECIPAIKNVNLRGDIR